MSALVTLSGVSVVLGGRQVLAPVDLTAVGGRSLAIQGRSGSGKSTLLLLLAGLMTPTTGQANWPGLDPSPRSGQLSLVPQLPALLPELTAQQNVALPLRLHGIGAAAAGERAVEALALMDLRAQADALPGELSGGQQQRVALARAVAAGPRLLLADEPTAALDRRTGGEIVQALLDWAPRTGCALVVATHDPDVAALMDDRLVLEPMPAPHHDGRVAAAGAGR